MRRRFFLLAIALFLVACAHDSADVPMSDDSMSESKIAAMNGESAYNEYCAGCHETGMMNAPIAGDAAEWPGLKSKQAYNAMDMGACVAKNIKLQIAG